MYALSNGATPSRTTAERLVLRWDSANSDNPRNPLLFDGDDYPEDRVSFDVDEESTHLSGDDGSSSSTPSFMSASSSFSSSTSSFYYRPSPASSILSTATPGRHLGGPDYEERPSSRWSFDSQEFHCHHLLLHDPRRLPEKPHLLQSMHALSDCAAPPPTSVERLGQPWESANSDNPYNRRLFEREVGMTRLEDEFCNILYSRVKRLEVGFLLSGINSLSMPASFGDYAGDSGGRFSWRSPQEEGEGDEETGGGDGVERGSSIRRTASRDSQGSACYRSGIVEIDLLPLDAVHDLRSIAERMIATGYERECLEAYARFRGPALDFSLSQLGVDRRSIANLHRLEWDAVGERIRRWICAARACVRVLFASERRLCDLVFKGLHAGDHGSGSGGCAAGGSTPFADTVKGAAEQLLVFPHAICAGDWSPEKLFKVIDLHDCLAELLPDLEAIFLPGVPDPSPELSICKEASDVLARLAEVIRGVLSEFERALRLEKSRAPVPGGNIHPLTHYVMNYISLITDYKQSLSNVIVDAADPLPGLDFSEMEDKSPLASHFLYIIAILYSNIEGKSATYQDDALSHLFMMNNLHYIVHKAKSSPELKRMIGNDYLRRLTGKYCQAAIEYQRAAWVKVLHCLRDDEIHTSGSFPYGISKTTLRERFKSFNSTFDKAHRTQAMWIVQDCQLKEELRISISECLLLAYRVFLGRFGHYIENWRHPELYIKYSVEDLEMALGDFFEGSAPSSNHRRRGGH